MKFNLFVLLFLLNYSCTQSRTEKEISKEEILPIKITLEGQLEEVHDAGPLTPDIHFNIDRKNIRVTVGATETYDIPYQSTTLNKVFAQFELKDFRREDYFYNPHFKYMSYLETVKEIDGKEYIRKFSNYKRQDIPIKYLALNKTEILKFSLLSNTLNKIAIDLLQEEMDYGSWFTASSMSEALTKPDKIYKLNLRSSTATELSPEIGKLINLRVLNISDTQIKSIPREIENCVHLKSLIANFTRLTEIPNSIGNLKKIRYINFGACAIQNLPEEFGQLETLWHLNLGDNQLTDLPRSLSNLKNLQFFDMSDNKFDYFPNAVLGMEGVGNLWMHANNFKRVPREIVKLKELHHFLVDVQEIENIDKIESLLPDVRIIDEANRRKEFQRNSF